MVATNPPFLVRPEPSGNAFGALTWQVSPDPMCIIDREGRFTALNPAWETVLGWAEREMRGELFERFLHPGDIAPSRRVFEAAVKGEPVVRFENRYRAKDGGHRWLSWVAVTEGGYIFCTARDVTEERAKQQKLDDLDEEAELREQFQAILGHDLRNPVAAFNSGLRILRRQPQSDATLALLDHLSKSVGRMDELIAQMMDFAAIRLGGGGVPVSPANVHAEDLKHSLREVAEEVRSAADGAILEESWDIRVPVWCDLSRIGQVLSNLLGNAVQHGAKDAPIQVNGAAAGDGRFTLSVANGGSTLTDSQLGRLFLPFQREGDRSGAASVQGLGLGLYIASEIARAHRGEMSVTQSGGDIRFTLSMPVEPARPGGSTGAAVSEDRTRH